MTEHAWLVLRFEAPLLAFGGVRIDQVGPTREFPAASMLTGLLANALGLHWRDWQAHQQLQDRLVFGVRWEREGEAGPLVDIQNARMEKSDRAWTWRGEPESRAGASYGGPHRRHRSYLMDAALTVAARLAPSDTGPDLDALAAALERPARPLFIGRKGCLPSQPLLRGRVQAGTAYEALTVIEPLDAAAPDGRAQWPLGEGPGGDGVFDLCDLRNWRTGLHGGVRKVSEGRIPSRRGAS